MPTKEATAAGFQNFLMCHPGMPTTQEKAVTGETLTYYRDPRNNAVVAWEEATPGTQFWPAATRYFYFENDLSAAELAFLAKVKAVISPPS